MPSAGLSNGFAQNLDHVSDMWDVASSEEHPVIGVPSFFTSTPHIFSLFGL
jgi:hypothetical protein